MKTREDQLAHGQDRPGQSSCPEVKRILLREEKEDPGLLQAGDQLEEKDRLEAGSWRLDFESQSVHEEIYWGCFYFFPWLRMCKKDKREPPS
uniref:Uncharacterized protein n=1 Tax=Pogona vitticeps TaxID=103695 RepID=A0ABM5FUS8_9SAUR